MQFLIDIKKYRVSSKYPVSGCGGRTRTYDLRVMSPTSFQLLYPAIFCSPPCGTNIIYHLSKKCKSFFIFFSNNNNGGDIVKKIFDDSAQLAAQIVENGGEISRAEESVIRICKSAGGKNINVFIIPSFVFASAEFDGERYTAFKRIYKTDLNLGRLEEVNNISRALCSQKNAEKKADYAYPRAFVYLCLMLATGAFCIYFGGTLLDALFSGLIGIIISSIPYKKTDFNIFSKTLIESTAGGILSFLPLIFGLNTHPDKIMTGTIMLLIPGMSIGNAMKDMMSGDIIAGILQLADAVVTAFAIALGFAAALLIFNSGSYA